MAGRVLIPVFISLVVVVTGTEFQNPITRLRNGIQDLQKSINEEKEFFDRSKSRVEKLEVLFQEVQHDKEEISKNIYIKFNILFS